VEEALSVLVGVLVATSVYLMLSRHLIRFLFGLVILGNAANLTIFTAGRLTPNIPPLIANGMDATVGPVANPLPQALVLTAIVISFGLLAFALVLVFRTYRALGTLDSDAMRVAEPEDPAAAGEHKSSGA
jgi:multicomponent Na+:H+ antiporter subunit C